MAVFTLKRRKSMAMDSALSHLFTFTPSVSHSTKNDTEEEITHLYSILSEAGEGRMPLDDYGFSRQFGWINDRFGVSRQLNHAA